MLSIVFPPSRGQQYHALNIFIHLKLKLSVTHVKKLKPVNDESGSVLNTAIKDIITVKKPQIISGHLLEGEKATNWPTTKCFGRILAKSQIELI